MEVLKIKDQEPPALLSCAPPPHTHIRESVLTRAETLKAAAGKGTAQATVRMPAEQLLWKPIS